MEKYLFIALTVYLLIINVVAFVIMGIDKKRARNKQWRISEAALFALALLFGALGSTAGMWYFRHKTRHWYFVVGMPLILIAEICVLLKIICMLYGGK